MQASGSEMANVELGVEISNNDHVKYSDNHQQDIFDTALFIRHLSTKYVGKQLEHKHMTSSTMDDAGRAALQGCPQGLVVLSDVQVKGRGQDGHRWESRDKGNIYATFVFRKPKTFQNRVGIQDMEFAGSCAVLKAVHDMGVDNARLKWKNDLLCSGHKLAGALVETMPFNSESRDTDQGVIFLLGIGVNVNCDMRRHPSLRWIATSVSSELGGVLVSKEQLLANICNHLETNLHMDRAQLISEMSAYQLFSPGSALRVLNFADETELFTGILEEIRQDWTCVIRDGDGKLHHVGDGVSLRPHAMRHVYLLSETPDTQADPLYSTLMSLLDTSVYNVIPINKSQLARGCWASASRLLVIRDHFTEEEIGCAEILERYVKGGGILLGIGSGCQVISQSLDRLCGLKSEPLRSADLLKVVFKDESSQTCYFYNYQSEGIYQITDALGTMEPLARNASEEVIAGCSEVGKGFAAMVGFNVEITYTDIEERHTVSEDIQTKIKSTVFQRDLFFQNVLMTLLSTAGQ